MCDRTSAAYESFVEHARQYGPFTLVLIDYHNSVGQKKNGVTSVNWVSSLMQENLVRDVVWVSGRTMLLPNRKSREAWLDRNLSTFLPADAAHIKSRIRICDWHDLESMELPRNTVVSVGFAEFTKDPGADVFAYIDEIHGFIKKHAPLLTVLSLSSVYQNDSRKAWDWFLHCVDFFPLQADWALWAGDFSQEAESRDELRARSLWRKTGDFFPGAYNWLLCPSAVRASLLKKHIRALDGTAAVCMGAWQDNALNRLESEFPEKARRELSQCAARNLSDFAFPSMRSETILLPPQPLSVHDEKSRGIAVRFRTSETDRGCLALYGGHMELLPLVPVCVQRAVRDERYAPIARDEIPSLFVNISVFSPWKPMADALDFVPGMDSLILQEPDGERTLLQSAVAMERGYSKEQFLSRLSNKAGLGLDGWKDENLRFFKSPTLAWTTAASVKGLD